MKRLLFNIFLFFAVGILNSGCDTPQSKKKSSIKEPPKKSSEVNVAAGKFGTSVETNSPLNPRYPLRNLTDGNCNDMNSIKLLGTSWVIINMPCEIEVNKIRIFFGDLRNTNNPSGVCAPKKFSIEGFINNGWVPLLREDNYLQPNKEDSGEKYYYEAKFPAMALSKIRISIIESGDTGKRVSSPDKVIVPESRRITVIREVQVLEANPGKTKLTVKAQAFGDFRLPFYRNSDVAELNVTLEAGSELPEKITVSIYSPGDNKLIRKQGFLDIVDGKNSLPLDIKGLEDGKYPVDILINEKEFNSRFRRLLRISNIDPQPIQLGGENVTGKKLFLFDDYHVESRKNLQSKTIPAKDHLVYQLKLDPSAHWAKNYISELGLTKDKKLIIHFKDAVGKNKYKSRYATCKSSSNLDKWKILNGEGPKAIKRAKFPMLPGQQNRRWRLNSPQDEAKLRFYDPKKDKKPPLDKIKVWWTGLKQLYVDGEALTYRGTYPVWPKDDEIIILTKSHILKDRSLPSGEEFEEDDDSNDNFGGQFLSKDGKEIYYIGGQVLKRFAPFIPKYENIRHSHRQLTLLSSKDGFNWKRKYIIPHTEKDPYSNQHYGITIYKDPQSDIYWGFLLEFNTHTQLFYPYIAASRDLRHWFRPDINLPFYGNDNDPEHWLWGFTFPPTGYLRVKNKLLFRVAYATHRAHFFKPENNSPQALKLSYKPRDIESWPFFNKVGKYEGLSKLMVESYKKRPLGLVETRPDGYIALCAGNTPGELITRSMRSSGSLSLNAKAEKDGWIKIYVLDKNNKPLKGYSRKFTGNSLNKVIFPNLPSKKFKLLIKLKNAKLFAVNM